MPLVAFSSGYFLLESSSGEAVIQREGQVSGDEQGMGLVNQRQQ